MTDLFDAPDDAKIASINSVLGARDTAAKLGEHFTLGEFTRSQMASMQAIDNWPRGPTVVANLLALVSAVLEPIRSALGPVTVLSGYRCPSLNDAVGGASVKRGDPEDSRHLFGQAADITVKGWDNFDLALWINRQLRFDQLILEGHRAGAPSSGWVHVGFVTSPGCNRQELLTYAGGHRRAGLFRDLG